MLQKSHPISKDQNTQKTTLLYLIDSALSRIPFLQSQKEISSAKKPLQPIKQQPHKRRELSMPTPRTQPKKYEYDETLDILNSRQSQTFRKVSKQKTMLQNKIKKMAFDSEISEISISDLKHFQETRKLRNDIRVKGMQVQELRDADKQMDTNKNYHQDLVKILLEKIENHKGNSEDFQYEKYQKILDDFWPNDHRDAINSIAKTSAINQIVSQQIRELKNGCELLKLDFEKIVKIEKKIKGEKTLLMKLKPIPKIDLKYIRLDYQLQQSTTTRTEKLRKEINAKKMLKFQNQNLPSRNTKSVSILKSPFKQSKKEDKTLKRVITLQIPNEETMKKQPLKKSINNSSTSEQKNEDVLSPKSSILKTSSVYKKIISSKYSSKNDQNSEQNLPDLSNNNQSETSNKKGVKFSIELRNASKISDIKMTFELSEKIKKSKKTKKQLSLVQNPPKFQSDLLSPKQITTKKNNRKSSVIQWSTKPVRKVSADNYKLPDIAEDDNLLSQSISIVSNHFKPVEDEEQNIYFPTENINSQNKRNSILTSKVPYILFLSIEPRRNVIYIQNFCWKFFEKKHFKKHSQI